MFWQRRATARARDAAAEKSRIANEQADLAEPTQLAAAQASCAGRHRPVRTLRQWPCRAAVRSAGQIAKHSTED